VLVAFAAVLLSAVCSGTATVLQAGVARRLTTADHLDPGMLLRLARRGPYLVAVALLVLGLLFAIMGLRSLPLFLVQAVRASSLGVTALLSMLVLKQRLVWSEIAAIGAVGVGLVLLALAAKPQSAAEVSSMVRFGLLVAVVAVGLLAVVAARLPPSRRSGLALGLLSGLCFALLALGARLLHELAPMVLFTDPAAWGMGLAGLLGLLVSATAMQRASVVTVTAATVGTETVVGAVLGVVACGDRPVPGGEGYALLGFALALAAALGLARFGAPAEDAAAQRLVHNDPVRSDPEDDRPVGQ
jgi:drug/metabolite transporter (DMT)-like permease